MTEGTRSPHIQHSDSLNLTVEATHYETKMLGFTLNAENLTKDVSLKRLFGAVSGTVTDTRTGNPIPGGVGRFSRADRGNRQRWAIQFHSDSVFGRVKFDSQTRRLPRGNRTRSRLTLNASC